MSEESGFKSVFIPDHLVRWETVGGASAIVIEDAQIADCDGGTMACGLTGAVALSIIAIDRLAETEPKLQEWLFQSGDCLRTLLDVLCESEDCNEILKQFFGISKEDIYQ